MTLKGLELSALLSAGIMMSNADGKVTDEEKEILVKELKSFNVSDEEARLYLKVAFDMSTDYTVQVLKGMTSEKKKYACGYLGAVMLSDGDLADKEVDAWRAFSELCGFPSMNLGEALEFWRNN